MKSNNNDLQISNIQDYKLHKIINDKGHSIREFPDRYEYCFIKDYENLYTDFQCDSIDMNDIFVQLLTVGEKILLVSIDFPKNTFDISTIIQYLDLHEVKLLGVNETFLYKVCEICQAIKFRGIPLILYEKGNQRIKIDRSTLGEVTEEFNRNEHKIDSYNSKVRDSLSPYTKIILNGQEIDYIPEIEIQLSRGLIVSNGNIVVATCIGDYLNKIGFFEKKGDPLPVSWIYDMDTTIYIDVYKHQDQEIINVQHNYSIDIDKLFEIRGTSMVKARIYDGKDYGTVEFNSDTQEVKVTHPNEEVCTRVYKYLNNRSMYTQSLGDEGILEHRSILEYPRKSAGHMAMALSEMTMHTGIDVYWD